MVRRGFTMIEVMVVTVVLALLASITVPRMVAYESGLRTLRDVQTIQSFCSDTRNLAMRSKSTYTLTYDDTTKTLTATPPDDDGSQIIGSNRSESTPQEKKLEQTWSISNVVNPQDENSSGGNFEVRFFGDGTADPRTATFTEDGVDYSFRITRDGTVTLTRGAGPTNNDPTEWEAGNLEVKTN